MSKYFAYRHIAGHIKVKKYTPDFGREALLQAEDSDFVDAVLQPYEAENRVEAERIAKAKLSRKPEAVMP